MTERLADIDARISGIRQVGAVVDAMRGISAARAQQARAALTAVDSYTAMITGAIGRVLATRSPADNDLGKDRSKQALIVFCAEQGFAGAFSERVLDAITDDLAASVVLLVGTYGAATARERTIVAAWQGAMPSQPSGVPGLADHLVEVLYARISKGEIGQIDAAFARWQPGLGTHVARRRLLPVDPAVFPKPSATAPVLTNLAPEALLRELMAEYLHAQICDVALHAFAAEHTARLEAMSAARRQIDRRLTALQSAQRRVRQEEITAEIIELAAGETASRTTSSR